MNVMRRLRGMFGTSLVWAGLWGVFGLVYAGVLSLFFLVTSRLVPLRIFAGNLFMNTLFWMTWGALAGLGFSGALMLAEGKGSLKDLSARRVAVYGAAGGMLGPLFVTFGELAASGKANLSYLPAYYGIGAVVGGALGLVTLWIARRAAGSDVGPPDAAQLSEGMPEFTASRSRQDARVHP